MNCVLLIAPQETITTPLVDALSQRRLAEKALLVREYGDEARLSAIFGEKRPAAVVVSLEEPEKALRLIESLHSRYPEVLLVGAGLESSPKLISAAIGAGMSGHVGPPFDPQALERALLRQPDGEAPVSGRVVSFMPARGGCGASSVATHVAMNIFRESRLKVLLLELDSHSGTVDFRLRLNARFTLAHALHRVGGLDEVWEHLVSRRNGIHVLPAAAQKADRCEADYSRMKALLLSARRVYDWVIGDLPGAIYDSCKTVLGLSEAIHLVCTPEGMSVDLARRKAEQLRDLGFDRDCLRLVLNRVDSKPAWDPNAIERIVNVPVGWMLRNDYTAVNTASLQGGLVPDDSQLGRQYAGLARHILGVPVTGAEASTASGLRNLLKVRSNEQRMFEQRLAEDRLLERQQGSSGLAKSRPGRSPAD